MAQTATTMANVLKDAWTDQDIQEQYFVDDNPLKRIEGVDTTMIGAQAQVPIWSDLNSGGYTTTSAAGGVLNTATNQATNQALYTLTQQFMPIALEFSAMNQTGSNLQAIIAAKNLEVRGAIATLRNQATRQLVTNGDGIVAACGATTTSTTVALVASPSGTAWGYDAIVRNWLRPGAVVDIGTTSDTDALVTATTVSGVAESASAPTITIGTSISTTAGTHFVYIANPNSATAANPELNGLRNIVNTSGALGGLNPATAGQEFWQAASRDTSTTVLSLDLMLNLNRAVRQKTGAQYTDVWFGLKQQQNYYALLQNQVRFSGDANISAGKPEAASWNGMRPSSYNAILDSDVYFLTLSDFVRVTGNYKTPTWMSSIMGANQAAIWGTGTTAFSDAVGWGLQVGVRRRNSHAAATGLTA